MKLDKSKLPIAIVLGDDFWNTYGIIRSLGEEGIKSVFINVCKGRSWVKHSRYIKEYWQVETPEAALALLEKEYGGSSPKPVVICSSDPLISAVDKNYNRLSQHFNVPNAKGKQGEINRLIDKDVMLTLADEVGLKHPRCISVKLDGEINLSSVYFPCLVKPKSSLTGGKEHIFICKTPEELNEKLDWIKTHGCTEVQIQNFIEKEAELLISGCALPGGKVILPGIITKIREYPMGFTSYAKIEPDIDKYVSSKKIKEFVTKTGYCGIFSLEFLYRKGEAYFLEINLRNDGNGYAPTYVGVNTHFLTYLAFANRLNGYHYREIITTTRYYQVESNSLNYYHFVGGGYLGFFKEFFQADFHLHFNWRDPMPAMHRFLINKLMH